jgi:hypothetical protein
MFTILHIFVWFSANAQLVSESWREKSLLLALGLSIPISMLAYYGTRIGYEALGESAWGVRFLAFGSSYLVFPILTYLLLGESMFTLKTMLCVMLSCVIIAIQIFV